MKSINWKQEWPFILLAFLLPLIFFWNVFTTHSFGLDCAPSVMGNHEPYGQVWTGGNPFCSQSPDPGAYVWQHPPHWLEAMRDYTSGQFPLWTQNIGGGIPLAANFISTAFFLPMLPFIFLFKISNNNILFLDLFFLFRYMMLAGGMYLFLRTLGLSRIVGFIGGIAIFSTGYYITLPNIGHHNVDMMFPLFLFCLNMLFITRKQLWMGVGAITLGISMLGGMPEISAFLLFFTALYILFVGLIYSKKRDITFIFSAFLSIVLGTLIGSVLFIPGLEYIINGGSSHGNPDAIPKSVPFQNLISFIFPEIYINPDVKQQLLDSKKITYHYEVWNYIGTILTFLFLTTITYFISRIKEIKKTSVIQLLAFFIAFAGVMIVQEYNILHTIIFEKLPVFNQTYYPKYSATLINFTLITAVCIGLFEISKKRTVSVVFGWLLMIGICIIASIYSLQVFADLPQYIKYHVTNRNVAHGVFYTTVILLAFLTKRFRSAVPYLIFALIIVEFLNYLPKGGYQGRYDTLRKPPSVAFLQARNDKAFRIFGVENILYPNNATIYDLQDMRMLDALWIHRYFVYVKNFFAEPYVQRITSLKETGAQEPANIVTNPFFDLLSVKYMLSYSPLESVIYDRTNLINQTIKANLGQPIKNDIVTIKKDAKSSLVFTGPANVSIPLVKPKGSEFLILQTAFIPSNQRITSSSSVRVKISQQSNTLLENIVPVNQDWQTIQVGPLPIDVSGQVSVELGVTPSLTEFHPVALSGLYWDSDDKLFGNKYHQIYNEEMRIYENTTAVPRVHFVKQTLCMPVVKKDVFEPVIKVMEKNRNRITSLAVIESEKCMPTTFETKNATIKKIDFQDMKITFTYTAPTSQYIEVQDAYYPGWNVYINGKKSTIDPVNIAFRGFAAPAGQDVKVELRYEPISFYVGAIITLIATLLGLYFMFQPLSIDESSLSLTLHKYLRKLKLK